MKKISLYCALFIVVLTAGFIFAGTSNTNSTEVIRLDYTNLESITTTTDPVKEDISETRQIILKQDIGIVDTTTTTIYIPQEALCPEWWETAKSVGWSEDLLPKLDRVIHRESTCRPNSHNPKDPVGGSYGLTQINGYWCTPNKYNPSGWLQAKGIVNNCNDLFDPVTNLKGAMALYIYSLERHGCGWNPWRFC